MSKTSEPIALSTPIKRGDTEIAEIVLRKPASGELRGLKLTDLLNGDVSATIRLVPRISQPSLTEQEVAAMDPADLYDCADEIAGFLNWKRVKALESQDA